MVGLGILMRVVKAFVGKPLQDTGVLPTRYYLHEVLRSLDQDNIGEAVNLLRISKGALVDRSRWKLVRQLVLFRCRVLRDRHKNRIHLVEGRIETLKKEEKLPWRWFRKGSAAKTPEYRRILLLEREAEALLESYERELKRL